MTASAMDSDDIVLKVGYSPRLLRQNCLNNAEEKDLKSAIVAGDLESVKSIIKENPMLLRSDIKTKYLGQLSEEWTPLHYACDHNQESIVEFLIEQEKGRRKIEVERTHDATNEGRDDIPSYNMRTGADRTPLSYALSTRIVEMLLDHFDDLEVTGEYGMPILWRLAGQIRLSKRVAQDDRLLLQY